VSLIFAFSIGFRRQASVDLTVLVSVDLFTQCRSLLLYSIYFSIYKFTPITFLIVMMTLYRTVQLSRTTREDTKCHQPGRPAICHWNRFVCTPRIITSECVLPTQTFSIYRQVQSLRAMTSPSATTTYRTATYRSTRSSTATAWTVMAPTADSWYTYVLCPAYKETLPR